MTRPAFVSPLDSLVGDGIEAAVQLKHQVRRRRLGWSHALNPSDERAWAAGDPPPRTGCSLEVLVDGVGAFAAIAEAIENARHFVHIAGWHVAPHLALVRGDRPTVLSQIMSRLVLEPRPRPLELKPHVRAVTTKTPPARLSIHDAQAPAPHPRHMEHSVGSRPFGESSLA